MWFFIENDHFCLKNDHFCLKNDHFCFKNDHFCLKNDFWRNENYDFHREILSFVHKFEILASRTRTDFTQNGADVDSNPICWTQKICDWEGEYCQGEHCTKDSRSDERVHEKVIDFDIWGLKMDFLWQN